MILFFILIILLSIYGVHWHQNRPLKPTALFPFLKSAQLVYADVKNNRQVFYAYAYGIKAKPDFIYQHNNQYIVIEYKSRCGPVYHSDIAQLIAAAIAVSSRYRNLLKGYVYTQSGEFTEINLKLPLEVLFAQIQTHVEAAKKILQHERVEVEPQMKKCQTCSYRQQCSYKKNSKKKPASKKRVLRFKD